MAKLIIVKSEYDNDYRTKIYHNWEVLDNCHTRDELISTLSTVTVITIMAIASKRGFIKDLTAGKNKKAIIIKTFADEILARREREKREEREAIEYRIREQNRKIKYCPCCDCEANIKRGKRGSKVQCNSCGVNSGWWPSDKEAIEVWNNRPGVSDY